MYKAVEWVNVEVCTIEVMQVDLHFYQSILLTNSYAPSLLQTGDSTSRQLEKEPIELKSEHTIASIVVQVSDGPGTIMNQYTTDSQSKRLKEAQSEVPTTTTEGANSLAQSAIASTATTEGANALAQSATASKTTTDGANALAPSATASTTTTEGANALAQSATASTTTTEGAKDLVQSANAPMTTMRSTNAAAPSGNVVSVNPHPEEVMPLQ